VEFLLGIGLTLVFLFAGVLFEIVLPQIKGAIGEKIVAKSLSALPKDKYFILNNILLETARGTTQIDHIVVSVFAIFVIETKNYQGPIAGSEHDNYWLYGYKIKFRNPICQNYGHVRALKKLLTEYKDIPIVPIVTFPKSSDLKKVNTGNANVVRFSDINNLIQNYQKSVMGTDMVYQIFDIIKRRSISGRAARKKHIGSIKELRSLRG
jgi:hypothetical protein